MAQFARWMTAVYSLPMTLAAGAALAESDAIPKPLSEAWAPPAAAAECEAGSLDMAAAPLFQVTPGPALALRKGAALKPGDVVLGAPEQRGVRCITAASRGALVAGRVSAARLAPVEIERALTPQFLAGTWRDGAYVLRVTTKGGRLSVAGTGTYKGAGPTPNEGGFDAEAAAGPAPLVLRDGGCIVVLERRGPFLLANDNERCGGHNVRFVGIYVRRGR